MVKAGGMEAVRRRWSGEGGTAEAVPQRGGSGLAAQRGVDGAAVSECR
jgi:hypothetical protein